MANSILVIQPYWNLGTWVFDDDAVGLVREPFVAGVPEMIEQLLRLAGISREQAVNGFRMLFSSQPFPGVQAKLEHSEEEVGGHWYEWKEYSIKGWLCPALFKYFAAAPAEIYVRAEPLASTDNSGRTQ